MASVVVGILAWGRGEVVLKFLCLRRMGIGSRNSGRTISSVVGFCDVIRRTVPVMSVHVFDNTY